MTGFMLLSGFVLHLTYKDKKLTEIKHAKMFYIKRLIGIIPLYYTIAFLHIVSDMLRGRTNIMDELLLFPIEVLGLQSVFTSLFAYSHNGGTWFISCILICYALFPFLQSIILQISQRKRIIALLFCFMVLLYSPIIQHKFGLADLYSNPFFRFLEFSVGVILADFHLCFRVQIGAKTNVMLVGALMVVLFYGVTLAYRAGIPANYMLYDWVALPCFSVILILLGKKRFLKLQHSKLLIYLSSISFTFFLSQVLPLWAISRHVLTFFGWEGNIIRILLSFTICLVSAILIHEFVEKPSAKFLKYKLLK